MAKIIKMRDREKGYTNIRNSIFLEDGISLKAVGLYCLMWSLPDDWQFSINGLAQITVDGPDSIRSALTELGEHHFINRVRMRSESGTLAGMDYQLWESPTLENPTQVNPGQETTQEENTKESISSKSNKEIRKRFTIPTPEEVDAYCRERDNGISGQNFVDFYTSKGWMVGPNHMRDWKAAVRTWEQQRKQKAMANGSGRQREKIDYD